MGIQVETRRSAAGGGNWSMNTKPCDSCKSATALLFCRADSAFLCLTCDSNIHSANKLASRHERVWMCEVCESAPASVTCKADAASLCVTCDADIHSANPLARRHERVPVVPFFDSAISAAASAGNHKMINSDLNFLIVPDHFVKGQPNEVVEEDEDDVVDVKTSIRKDDGDDAASWLFQNPPSSKLGVVVEAVPDLMLKSGIGVGGVDYLFSDVDSYLDLDYPDINGGEKQFQNQHNQNGSAGSDSVVPVATNPIQNHPAASFNHSENHCYEFDFSKPKPAYSFNTQSVSHSVSSSEVGVVPDSSNCNSMTDISNPFSRNNVVVTQLTGLDREARVLRYREKRKNRKFEKTIRYASRKAYAETRPRIKGRFAKRTETEIEADNQMERMYHSNNPSSGGFMIDSGYGIVPSF
ncbi:hypothetical protein MKW98_009819 [Papaver atlanticum]|uniref:CONSTANS-like protein n=1 Tax=Papaver atlanticum TaxID=357466 RepID=A0AAD4XM90_9MAGN|nr:hypothetical protein MKW98_009819 [Papaver atlanticum]